MSAKVDSGLTLPKMLNMLLLQFYQANLLMDPVERSFNAYKSFIFYFVYSFFSLTGTVLAKKGSFILLLLLTLYSILSKGLKKAEFAQFMLITFLLQIYNINTIVNQGHFKFMILRLGYKFSGSARILTGIQPTGSLTIGNYLGSIDNLIKIQKQYTHAQTFMFIADLHSLTTAFDLEHAKISYDGRIGANTISIAKNVISSGVLLNKNFNLFVQSAIKQHSQLCWLLGCIGPQHWLNMMIQYKEKSTKNSSLGIYSYPVLMAADILLYKSNFVPVGQDQKQHLQLTKRYAERFNSIVQRQFFPIPNYIVAKVPKVMSLVDPNKKMSKSDTNQRSRINMTDSKDQIADKIRRAVTDSQGNTITYEPQRRKGLANLLRLYSCFKQISTEEAVSQFSGKGIKELKQSLTQAISTKLKQIQNKMENLSEEQTKRILANGAQNARKEAEKTIKGVKQLLKLYH